MKADELCNLILCSRAPLVIVHYSIICSVFCRAACEFEARWAMLWRGALQWIFDRANSKWFKWRFSAIQSNGSQSASMFCFGSANKRSEPWDQGCRILSSAWSERPPGSWWTPPAWSGSASRCRPPRPAERFPAETPGSDWYGSWSKRDKGQKGHAEEESNFILLSNA